MNLLPETQNCRLRMRRECRERFPRHRLERKQLVGDPVMHHGMCVTHVPWCMSGSLTPGGGQNVPGIPGACTTCNFAYLAKGPWAQNIWTELIIPWLLMIWHMVFPGYRRYDISLIISAFGYHQSMPCHYYIMILNVFGYLFRLSYIQRFKVNQFREMCISIVVIISWWKKDEFSCDG